MEDSAARSPAGEVAPPVPSEPSPGCAPTTAPVPADSATGSGWRLLPDATHHQLLWLLLLGSFLLRLLWLSSPEGGLIFDERYYVNASRVILGVPPRQDTYADRPLGLDPNTEHPPLAKLIVAGSMRLLGDNPYGWRVPSVLLGTASIWLLYAIGRRLCREDPYVGLLAAALLAFDNLNFVHGRVDTLDVFQLGFVLFGLWLYLARRPALGGIGFALAGLCKIGGLLGLGAIVLFELLRLRGGDLPLVAALRSAARRLTLAFVACAVAFLLLLWGMDRVWVGYTQPFEHLERILTYGQALRRPAPSGIESYPWQWLWNDVEIPYIRVDQQVKAGDEVREIRPIVWFRGAMNPYFLLLLPLGFGSAISIWWRRAPGLDLAALCLAWFLANWGPFVLVSVIGQRIAYLFYILPALPAIALGGSYVLLRAGLGRAVLVGYLVAVLLGFYGYFPFRPVP